MRKILAVAWREVEERRHYLLISLVSGTLAVIVPFAKHRALGGEQYETVRDLAAVTTAVGIALAFALILGATVVVRDLSEHRLGFYFARPLSPGEIWVGKILGAFAL